MQLGIDRLLLEHHLLAELHDSRVALLAHPASVTSGLDHTLDALATHRAVRLTAAFGPQHGLRGDKQDNMVETGDEFDSEHAIPVFSLYGKVRRPTDAMLDTFDVLLIDVQDVGCRVYTFLTTLFYLLEDCARKDKSVWVLDRPNPAGRPIDGTLLSPGFESFVGVARVPMRHGLTLGEAARWYTNRSNLNLDLNVITMREYDPGKAPGYGWPADQLAWVNPSPNMASLNAARAYSGTVLLEGTTLSEGRGTTRPLEIFGAPDIDADRILKRMQQLSPEWVRGCRIRRCYFEPTFHKHLGKLCSGIQIHTDHPKYAHELFRSFRLVALFLKSLRLTHPDYPLWRDFPYEYVTDRLPIDVISGSEMLRTWIDEPQASIEDLEQQLERDERIWREDIREAYLY